MTMKKRLRAWLADRRLEEIVEVAEQKRRTLGLLISLTYDREPLIGWRAIEALGAAARRIVVEDPDCVRDLLRRLYWLISEESGGICWHAPEALAEIVHQCADTCDDYVPIIISLLHEMAEEDLMHFRPGVLWAIGRLGPLAEPHFEAAAPAVIACLNHPDVQVRGMAVWCLTRCGRPQTLAEFDGLAADNACVTLYNAGQLEQTTVSHLVRQTLAGEPLGTRAALHPPSRP